MEKEEEKQAAGVGFVGAKILYSFCHFIRIE